MINSSDHKMKKFGYNKLIALIETGMQICYKIFDLLWLKEGNE